MPFRRPRAPVQPPKFADLLAESAAGLALSGDSGSGKSNAMLVMFEQLIRQGSGGTLIDPHGDLASDAEQMISALPARFRQRCLVIRPCDLSRIIAINPLAVPHVESDWLRWRARVASKVSQVTRILLYAWGERDFNSKPLLFKWMTRSLTTLAVSGLTLPDARHFFDVGSDVYSALAEATPDLLARGEMMELADMRPRDREELIASTKNRLIGFLENPAVELTLGRPKGWLDPAKLIRERYIAIISLERGGVLREEDVEIFANLFLIELLNAAYNLSREERTPHVILLDELPVFGSSFDLITRGLAQVRKFLIRFVCAFQGTQYFPDRTEDRLLHALISQCRTTVVFRHRNPADAKFFGEMLALPTFDPLREKHRLTQLQQYQDGHDLVYLTDETDNWSDARQDGGSRSDAESDTTSDSTTDSRSSGTSDSTTERERELGDAVTRARSEENSSSTSRATGRGTTRTDASNWSTTQTQGGSRTRKATLVPRLRTREVVTSIQFFTPEEQNSIAARDLTGLPTGEAIVYSAGSAAMRVRFPLAQRPFARTPKFAAKRLKALRLEITARAHFASPRRIAEERREFEQRLISYLENLTRENRVPEKIPALPPPPEDNPLLSI